MTTTPGPTTLRFDVREYLDQLPMTDVRVEARAVLIAKTRAFIQPVEGDTDSVVDLIQGNRVCETKNAVTGADGTVTLQWDLASDPLFQAGWDHFRNRDLTPLVYVDAGITLSATAPPTLFRQRDPIPVGDWQNRRYSLDLAVAIVGHVTDTTARLWFAPSPQVLAAGLTARCVVSRPGGRRTPPRAYPVTFAGVGVNGTDHPHAMVDLTRLTADTRYEYVLYVANGPTTWVAARGSFRTVDPAATGVRLAFGSCNRPKETADLACWTAMRDWMPDLAILLGDQVYGDGVDKNETGGWSTAQWSGYYDSVYRNQWRHRRLREVLRATPTYMMHDDHDVVDDWGTTFTTLDLNVQDRVRAAQAAFEVYQHSHNPPMPHRVTTDDAYDYALRRGPVAIYVLDERTRRGIETADPVLGTDQWTRLRAWATSPDVATADVVILVSPVPLALCDTERAEQLLQAANSVLLPFDLGRRIPWVDLAVTTAWTLGEEVTGWSVSRPPTPTYADGRVVEPDLADQWTHKDNIAELGRLVELLFTLQNDPARQRAVVVLSGDAHVGATYALRSPADLALPNDVIYQVVSSPIGRPPDDGLATALGIVDGIPAFGGGFSVSPGMVPLAYTARIEGEAMAKRNFGSVNVTRRAGTGRVYDVNLALHFAEDGTESRLDLLFDLDTPGPPSTGVPRVAPVLTSDRHTTRILPGSLRS